MNPLFLSLNCNIIRLCILNCILSFQIRNVMKCTLPSHWGFSSVLCHKGSKHANIKWPPTLFLVSYSPYVSFIQQCIMLLFSMGKLIIFINKDIIVQQYTLFRIVNTYITSYCNSSMKNDHIFIIYVQWKVP